MTFKKISDQQAELHQPATPNFHVESTTRFTLRAPWYFDLEFRCKPHQHVHERGCFDCFWASYINGPADKSLYFPGGWSKGELLWMQLCTQAHNDESTVLAHGDDFELTWEGGRMMRFSKTSPASDTPSRYITGMWTGWFTS